MSSDIGFDRASSSVSAAVGARQGGEVEPRDRVVGDALEDPGPGLRVEVEVLDLLRRRSPGGSRGRAARACRRPRRTGPCRRAMRSTSGSGCSTSQNSASTGFASGRTGWPPGCRPAPRRDALGDDDVAQRLDVTGRAGFGHHVEGVDRAREAVPGEPVARRLDQHHPVARGVERPGQRQRLGHLAAADQHGARVVGHRAPRRDQQRAHQCRARDRERHRQRDGQQGERPEGLRAGARRARTRPRRRGPGVAPRSRRRGRGPSSRGGRQAPQLRGSGSGRRATAQHLLHARVGGDGFVERGDGVPVGGALAGPTRRTARPA